MKNKKIAVVTGVTSGIGKEVALGLIRRDYSLYVLARNKNKFNELKQMALSIDETATLHLYEADLSLVKSTNSVLTKIKEDLDSIDVLFQSAGLIPGKIELTKEGVERTFAVSYLTRYLIIKELLPLVKISNEKLIVNMAGAGQNGKIHFDDINFQKRKFQPMNVVKQFQQANDALILNVDKENDDINAYCLIPGLVDTGIHDGWPKLFRFFIRKILGTFIMVTPEKASKIPLGLIDGSITTNGVLVNEKGKAIKPSKELSSSRYQKRVIEMSERMIKPLI